MKARSVFGNSTLKIITATLLLVVASVIGVYYINQNSRADAVKATDFKDGSIISDYVFYNKNSMNVQQIQSFLNSLIPTCLTWNNTTFVDADGTRVGPPFVCLNNYYENPTTGETSFEKGGGAFAGGISAAQIIYDAAQAYGINPQVLLVMLKKESLGPLTADNWPTKWQYRYAMGYACPDSGPNNSANCNDKQAGFYKQVNLAAWQFKYYKDHPNDYRYAIGWNDIQYSPNASCGTKRVYIENIATLSLYIYTPYVPNASALANYPGTANCGAYGNRNFFMFFSEWLGNPAQYTIKGGILEQYTAFGGQAKLGAALSNEYCGLTGNACFQDFQFGSIYWTPTTNKAYTLIGGMRERWNSIGKEWSSLGYPVSNETYVREGIVQTFQRGSLLYAKNGTYIVKPEIDYKKYSYFGSPKSDIYCGIKNGGCYQTYDKGLVYWSATTGSQPIMGGMYTKWDSTGKEWGSLGYPTSSEYYDGSKTVQKFEKGELHFTKNGNHLTFSKLNYSSQFSYLGNPKSDSWCGTKNGGCYQVFDKGYIYQSAATGAHAIFGGMYEKWSTVGKEWGSLGYPTSSEYYDGSKIVQKFEKGTIVWTPTSVSVSY